MWPLSRRCIAAVCHGDSPWLAFRLSAGGLFSTRPNTVAAQRRILTVFPIYFLRHPAASRRIYAQFLLRVTPAILTGFFTRIQVKNVSVSSPEGG